jgi:cyclophilin family peptidyl-prolyl cis-trans isomerase
MRIAPSSDGVSVHRVLASLVCQTADVVQQKWNSKNGTVKWNSKMAQRFSLLFSLLATSERILELVVRNGAVSPDA